MGKKKEEQTSLPQTTAPDGPSPIALGRNGIAPTTMEEAWRYAVALSRSSLVPTAYRNRPEDCLIAVDTAKRLGVATLIFLQNTYVVNGRLGMEGQLIIAIVNRSCLLSGPIQYEVEGNDPFADAYRVRAHAVLSATGEQVYGPWVDWRVVKAEGWHKRDGSKWNSMPEQMFAYRAATWFARRHCPEALMGMSTVDELCDIGDRRGIESHDVSGTAAAKRKIADQQAVTPVGTTQASTDKGHSDATEGAPVAQQDAGGCQSWRCLDCDAVFDPADAATMIVKGETLVLCPRCDSLQTEPAPPQATRDKVTP